MIRKLTATRKRKFAIAAAAGVTCAVAWAAWLVDGQGPGGTGAGQLQPLVVEIGDTFPTGANRMTPGTTGDGHFRVTNPNPPLTLVRAEPGAGVESPTTGLCTATAQVTTETLTGLSIPLPAGTSQVVVPDLYRLAATAPDACQGINFAKPAKLTASTPNGP